MFLCFWEWTWKMIYLHAKRSKHTVWKLHSWVSHTQGVWLLSPETSSKYTLPQSSFLENYTSDHPIECRLALFGSRCWPVTLSPVARNRWTPSVIKGGWVFISQFTFCGQELDPVPSRSAAKKRHCVRLNYQRLKHGEQSIILWHVHAFAGFEKIFMCGLCIRKRGKCQRRNTEFASPPVFPP